MLQQNKTETIHFDLNHLLFIKSDGNYVEVYLEENDQINKLFHRVSLRTIENELGNYPNIVRKH